MLRFLKVYVILSLSPVWILAAINDKIVICYNTEHQVDMISKTDQVYLYLSTQ